MKPSLGSGPNFGKLSPSQKARFTEAMRALRADIAADRGIRAGLRVKHVQGIRGVFEVTWAPDGRATFAYGPEQIPGHAHIIWRRVGSHDILADP